ncbi:MAG: hypothetical protein ACYTGS_00560, partial [Planctomycetota bacterium]
HDAGRPCLVPPNTLPPVLLFRLPLEDWVRQGGFVDFDLGFFDHETWRLEPIENPFAAKVLPMSPE